MSDKITRGAKLADAGDWIANDDTSMGGVFYHPSFARNRNPDSASSAGGVSSSTMTVSAATEPLFQALRSSTGQYEYGFDFSRGMGAWSTWMLPSVPDPRAGAPETGFVRLQAPGPIDPNHIDGIGSLSLIAHLPAQGFGAPGILDLRNAEIDITIRTHDFVANGARIVFWICSTLPSGELSYDYPVGMQITNWANTGGDLASAITDEWQTLTVRLDTDPEDWTEAGNYRSAQGDWGARYAPLDLEEALSRVDATLHLVAISDHPDQRPSGFLDISSIVIRTEVPAIATPWAAPELILRTDEDTVVRGVVATLAGPNSNTSFQVIDGSVRHGSVIMDGRSGRFTFTPEANFFGPGAINGSASFQYVRIVGDETSAPMTAMIYITPRNDAPTTSAKDESAQIGRDTRFSFSLLAGLDIDGDGLTFSVVENSVTHGSVALDGVTGSYVFTPEAGYLGDAGFSYRLSDGQIYSAVKHVALTVVEELPPLPPFSVAIDALIAGDIDTFVRLTITLAIHGDVNASYHYGTWLADGQHVARDPASAAMFLGQGLAATPDAALQLAQLYIAGDGVTRDYGEARSLLATIGDTAAGIFRMAMLDYLGLGGPADPAAAGTGFLTAAKMGHAEAMATVGRRYLAGDGVAASMEDAYFWMKSASISGWAASNPGFAALLATNLATAGRALSPDRAAELDAEALAWRPGDPTSVNDAPVVAPGDEAARGLANSTIFGTLLDGTDADGDRLTWHVRDTAALHGRIALDPGNGTFTYIPEAGFSGQASFSYVLNDGQADSAEKTVDLQVTLPTEALPDFAETREGETIVRSAEAGVLANDTSSDGSALTVVAVNGETARIGQEMTTMFGTITLHADGSFTYRADRAERLVEGEQVRDTITYRIANAVGEMAAGTLDLFLTGVGGTVLEGDGVIVGSRWNDRLTGGTGLDYLIGLDGDDRLDSGTGGPNTLQGGRGDDVYIVRSLGDSVIEFTDEGVDTVMTSLPDYALREHLENLFGTSDLGQVLQGNDLSNIMRGGMGRDVLIGGGGSDVLHGGSVAPNELLGGSGDDRYVVTSPGDTIVEFEGEGIDTIETALPYYELREHVENLIGTSGIGQVLLGTVQDNVIAGGGGNDTIDGGAGSDILSGGLGRDDFLFTTQIGSDNIDRILDFTTGDDRIVLSAALFGGIAGQALAEAAFSIGMIAADAANRILHDRDTGVLYYDADGVGPVDAVAFARITPEIVISAADFIFA